MLALRIVSLLALTSVACTADDSPASETGGGSEDSTSGTPGSTGVTPPADDDSSDGTPATGTDDGSTTGMVEGTSSDGADDDAGSSTGSTGEPAGCTALLCEDFEASDEIDASVWTINAGYHADNAVTVESDMVWQGSNAAHAHLSETQGGFAILRETTTFPALADELWGRAYVYDTVSTSASHTGYVTAYADGQHVLEIGQYLGHWQLTYYHDGGESPHGSSVALVHDAWVCLEWRFARSGDNLIEIYVDGEQVDTYAADGVMLEPFTELGLGIDNHGANPPGNDLYMDDIAIDAERIGCES